MADSSYDDELKAMAAVMAALSPLDKKVRLDVIRWVMTKLDLRLDEKDGQRLIEESKSDGNGSGLDKTAGGAARAGNINTVVSKIQADSCRTILIAAALRLSLLQGKDTFSRGDLVGLAKAAKAWKADYANQTSTMIGRLTDAGVLGEKSKDVFYLPDNIIEQYRPLMD